MSIVKRLMRKLPGKAEVVLVPPRQTDAYKCKEKGCNGMLLGARLMIQEEIKGALLCSTFAACKKCKRLHSLRGNLSFTRDGKRLFQSRRGSSVILVKNRRNDKVVKRIGGYLC